jgi:hypothetical protein
MEVLMKSRFLSFGLLIVILEIIFTLVGCLTSTSNNAQRGQVSNSQMRLLDPPDIIGKKLVGSDENGTYSFYFNQNGTFEYIINDNVYSGNWSFDRSARMYRYTFDWTEGDKKQGYIMDFLTDGPEITIAGH